MEIAHFLPGQQDYVAQFWFSVFQELGWPTDQIEGIDNVVELFHPPHGFLLVMQNEGKIVGCGGVKPLTESIGIVKRFYVDAELRVKGFATQFHKSP